MAMIKLQTEPIDIAACYAALKAPQYGGIATFSGTVREWTGRVHTDFIEYSAHEQMAVKELEKLVAPIEAAGSTVVIVHRLGQLTVGEEAVFIGVASPHRPEAFAACQLLIDNLKKTVPIWKKEIDGEGTNRVERWGK